MLSPLCCSQVDRDEDKPAAEAMFKKVARAYEVLGDDDLRRRYDNGEDVDDANAMNQKAQQQSPFQHGFGGFGGGNPFGGGFGGGQRSQHFGGGQNFYQRRARPGFR